MIELFVLFLSCFFFIIIILIRVLLKVGKEYEKQTEIKYRGIRISQIDMMEGIEFENYLQKVLIHLGYEVKLTPASGDFGVDLVASRDNESIAIQAKRQNSAVSRRAISDAVAGMNYYNCTDAMVITNNYFTPDAKTLADSNNCTLIDRDTLARWINDYQIITNVIPPKNVVLKTIYTPPTKVESQATSKLAASVNLQTVDDSLPPEKPNTNINLPPKNDPPTSLRYRIFAFVISILFVVLFSFIIFLIYFFN